MSGKFLLLLTVFVLLLCACLAVFLLARNPSWLGEVGGNKITDNFLRQSPSPVASKTTLSITAESPVVTPGQRQTLSVVVDSQGSNEDMKPKTIQLEIAYNPKALTDISIAPGDFFQNPTITLHSVNEKLGRISYALVEAPEAKQQTTGTVAVITFTPNPTFSGKETDVIFLPKTIIRSASGENILTTTYGTKLIFPN